MLFLLLLYQWRLFLFLSPNNFPMAIVINLSLSLLIQRAGTYPEQGKWRKIISDGEKGISLIEENVKWIQFAQSYSDFQPKDNRSLCVYLSLGMYTGHILFRLTGSQGRKLAPLSL